MVRLYGKRPAPEKRSRGEHPMAEPPIPRSSNSDPAAKVQSPTSAQPNARFAWLAFDSFRERYD